MDALLREVYYNRETGFRSIDETLRQARALNNARAARAQRLRQPYVSIRVDREDVKRFLENQEVRQETTRKRREGSYVPVAAREEFECDLAEFDSGRRYMLACRRLQHVMRRRPHGRQAARDHGAGAAAVLRRARHGNTSGYDLSQC